MDVQGSKIRYRLYATTHFWLLVFFIELVQFIYSGVTYPFPSSHWGYWIGASFGMVFALVENLDISIDNNGITGYKCGKWYKRPTEMIKINFNDIDKVKSKRCFIKNFLSLGYVIHSKNGDAIKISMFYYGFLPSKEIYKKLVH